jgi:hypothetical protein
VSRREIPVDPNAGPVQRFAYELRKLRQEAGGITYRDMARRSGFLFDLRDGECSLTRQEWERYVPGQDFQMTCSPLPGDNGVTFD